MFTQSGAIKVGWGKRESTRQNSSFSNVHLFTDRDLGAKLHLCVVHMQLHGDSTHCMFMGIGSGLELGLGLGLPNHILHVYGHCCSSCALAPPSAECGFQQFTYNYQVDGVEHAIRDTGLSLNQMGATGEKPRTLVPMRDRVVRLVS